MTVTAAWRKVIRDVWCQRARAALVISAIAVGLAGFLAVLSTYAILRRELNRGYLATNPASAVIVTDRIDRSAIVHRLAAEALLAIAAPDDPQVARAQQVLRATEPPK